jgi:hypothetical protein
MAFSVLKAGIMEKSHDGINHLAEIPIYFGFMLLQFVLPYYVGRWIAHRRDSHPISPDENQIGRTDD